MLHQLPSPHDDFGDGLFNGRSIGHTILGDASLTSQWKTTPRPILLSCPPVLALVQPLMLINALLPSPNTDKTMRIQQSYPSASAICCAACLI